MMGPVTVPPTVTASHSASRSWDVTVIGAGPAGALAAGMLSAQGCSVLLVERRVFPRYKVCGACLNPLSVDVLHTEGASDALADAIPLHHFCLATRNRSVTLNIRGRYSLSRERFDAALVRMAVDRGVEFISDCTAQVQPLSNQTELMRLPRGRASVDRDWDRTGGVPTGVTSERVVSEHRVAKPRNATRAGTKRSVALRSHDGISTTIESRVVIAADGLTHSCLSSLPEFTSRVVEASRIGAGTVIEAKCDRDSDDYYSGGIFMAVNTDGYVGLVRLEDGRLNVAAALSAASVRRAGGLGAAAGRIIESAGFPITDGLTTSEWHGTPALTRSTRPLAAQGLFVIGDAAGYVEPFTGEGIGWALTSASNVVPLVCRGLDNWTSQLEVEWHQSWQEHTGRRQHWCRGLAGVLRYPTAVSLTTRLLALCPWLAEPIINSLDRGLSRTTSCDPSSRLAIKAG